MSRHRLHRLPDRQPQGRHLYRGRRRAARLLAAPGSRRFHPVAAPDRAGPRGPLAGGPAAGPPQGGVLVLDDSTLDKPYAEKIGLVSRHWSGKHKSVVWGITLITPVWTDGDRKVPCDYRLYDKANDGQTKNDHFRAMLAVARDRGFAPECVAFESWDSGLENLKAVRRLGWRWLTPLQENRNVNRDRQGPKPVSRTAIAAGGTVVPLEGYGLIRVLKIVSRDGDIEYRATGDLTMDELGRLRLSEWCWA